MKYINRVLLRGSYSLMMSYTDCYVSVDMFYIIVVKFSYLEFSVNLLFSLGACEGTLACSTCHLIFEDHIFEKLDAITDEEMDMLDLAYGLTET